MGFIGGEYDADHVVYVGGVVRGLDTDFCGVLVHDGVS